MEKAEFPKLDPNTAETKWQAHWEKEGLYKWDPAASRDNNYVIDTPPPTVSGNLHIGHVFSYTQTDLLARYQRMKGKNVYYPMGFDDNGLPSERLVEQRRKVRAGDLPRADFTKLCYEVVEDSEKEFTTLFRRIALSVDWTQTYRTISPHSWKISQMSLLDLHQKGHLFRSPQPTLWDPTDRTALAQAEIVEKEQRGTMYTLPFTLDDGGTVRIATTRPELLPACVALMCHPEDKRASQLIGRKAYTPLLETEVVILPDLKVDREKGTGVVMCCTFGDQNDVEWWRTYTLPLRSIIDRKGLICNLETIGTVEWPSKNPAAAARVAEAISGMYVRKASVRIVELLRERGLIEHEEQITHMVPTAERSGTPIEILVTAQWMVRLLDKKELLLAKGREITWHPAFMRQRFEEWVSNLKWDWCISRQRYFGVPLPFWYSKRNGEEGKILLAHPDDLPVNPLVDLPRGYSRGEIEPDHDVLDTWATSSVSPQINSHALSETFAIDWQRHRRLFPMDLRAQAHEIIRTWAFYTIAKAALHENSVPFHNIAISGWCLSPDQSKMSKSKGNIILPQQLIERFGVDVVRYWTANARLGRDTAFSEDVLKIGKRLVTKLWNASAFVASHIAGFRPPATSAVAAIEVTQPFDRWLLISLRGAVETATAAFEDYDYSEALLATERFFWKDYCDNYLELVKRRLYSEIGTPAARRSAQAALYFAHRLVLAMFAPFLPYVTEELFSLLYPVEFGTTKSVHTRGSWPNSHSLPTEAKTKEIGDIAIDILAAARKLKTNKQVSMRASLENVSVSFNVSDAIATWTALAGFLPDLKSAINCAGEISLAVELGALSDIYSSDNGRCSLSAKIAESNASTMKRSSS